MMTPLSDIIIAVAFAHTAEIGAWQLATTKEEEEVIERVLRNLFDLGQIASFSIGTGGTIGQSELVSELQSRLGNLSVGACLVAPAGQSGPLPSFLMPVWTFDHVLKGKPAATGRLLGLDLELIATPSADEELGARLPGHAGRWLIHARPLEA